MSCCPLKNALQVLIASEDDYEGARRRYAPQGGYEAFEADGVRRNYQLSYQPLDTDEDGVIGPTELAIYVDKPPLRHRGR